MKMKLLLGLCTLVLFGWLWPSVSEADTYRNCGVSEPAINASANTLWCDDFEDGDYAYTSNATSNPLNDGWDIHSYAPPGTFPDPAGGGGHAFGRCQTATGVALMTGLANTGVAGTNCAGSSGLMSSSYPCCQEPTMGEHGISQAISFSNRDLYIRYYLKCVAAVQCMWSDNTKTAFTHLPSVGEAGLGIGATGAFPNGMRPFPGIDYNFPPIKGQCNGQNNCITNMHAFASKVDPKINWTGGQRNFNQNVVGNGPQDTGDCSVVPLHTCYEFGDNVQHWYYIEQHIRYNSVPGVDDGIYEMWIDDCGVTGFTGGCATGGTLRSRFTDVRHSEGAVVGSIYKEQHAGGGSQHLTGEWYYDQFVASKVRIGPMGGGGGGGGGDTAPPAPPSNLRVL